MIRRAAAFVMVLATLSAVFFGLRTYSSYLLLRSAAEAGAPKTSAIRAWMSLGYVAGRFNTSEAVLKDRLGIAVSTPADTTLIALAETSGVTRFSYIQRVQKAVADGAFSEAQSPAVEPRDWLSRITEDVLSALVAYGYPVLAATLLLGAIGLPVPTAFSVIVAGSMSSLGHLNVVAAGIIAVACSVLGDGVAYQLGRSMSPQFVEQRGWMLGLNAERQERGARFFTHWGAIAILVSRTLVSHLSSVVSFLAGSSRYSPARFVAVATAGRVTWTGAYLALGYLIGGHVEAAADFLGYLSGLLIALVVSVASAVFLRVHKKAGG